MESQIKYPSVTRILSATKSQEQLDILEKWRKKVGEEEANRISNEALERGKNYDNMVQEYILGNEIKHNKLKEHLDKFNIVSTEENIFNHRYQYKGRYDCIFEKNELKIINDFKGSSKRKRKDWIEDYFIQIAAYWEALEESGILINYGMITVILDNNIQYFVINCSEKNYYFNLFLNRLNKYKELNYGT